MTPSQLLKKGNEFPYDAPDTWWRQPGGESPPVALNHAHFIARGIAKALEERCGATFNLSMGESSRTEMIEEITSVIEEGLRNPTGQTHLTPEANMAEQIYGKGVEKCITGLRLSVYRELGNLLKAQTKGAMIPPDIMVNNLRIPLVPSS